MKQQYGNIRRTFMEQKPEVYDRKTRIAYMDFTADTQEKTDNASQDTDKAKCKEEKTTIEGFSGFVIQTDGIMDYAHIKSQLVEAAYPQKEEHALAFNTIDALLKKVDGVELTEEESQDLANYKDFSEYRALCANCAHAIIDNLFT
jgi:hypothetical protein|nr:MAG TPA: hypothetical protein [Caudoviricetes sp.]